MVPALSVIVCTRNRAASLTRLLKSMRRLVVPAHLDWELVVVDNGSTDHTEKVIRRFSKRLPIRHLHEAKPGLAHARNRALESTAQNHTVWTDDDATVHPEWLSVYERAFRYWPDFTFFGGPISPRFEGRPPRWIEAASISMPEAFTRLEPTKEFVELGPACAFFPFGANMAFRSGVFESLRFDTRLGRQPGAVLRGSEEIQLMKQIVRQEGRGLWLPPARVEHWIDAERQTIRHVYDHAFGDGFIDEMVGWEGRGSDGLAVASRAIDESFTRLERELSETSEEPAVWLPKLKARAEEDGRALACASIPGHHRYQRRRTTRRLLILGLDGFEASVADRLIGEGRLPNFEALRRSSARYALDHGDALFTGLAWEHFSVGRSPSDYGRYSAMDFDVDTYRTQQRGTTSATFLEEVDAHAVVFDVPYFDLARTRCASGITNWGAHDPGTLRESRPGSLAVEIEQRFGGYPGAEWIYGFVWPDPGSTAQMAERLAESARLRGRIGSWLLTERFPEWDLALVTAGELHSATEAFWHGIDPSHPLHGVASAPAAGRGLRAVYEATDRMLGELREARPDADLLVFSMHGMGPNLSDVASMLLLPELLFRHAFHANAFTPDPAWEADREGLPLLAPGEDWSTAVNARIRIPASLTSEGSNAVPESNLHWMPAERYQPAWPEMDAFAIPSLYDGRIRINLAGRERRGRVSLDQYESCLRRISDVLMSCRDSRTGEKIVDHIRPYEGANPLDVDRSDCDLKIRWNHAVLGLVHPELGTIGPTPYRRTGGHGGHGIAWIHGEGIAPGDYGTASSFDIVPTALAMLGERSTRPVSGRVIPLGTLKPS